MGSKECNVRIYTGETSSLIKVKHKEQTGRSERKIGVTLTCNVTPVVFKVPEIG